MNKGLEKILYTLKFCGIQERYLSDDFLGLKYIFVSNSGGKYIIIVGRLEVMTLTTTDNMVPCVEINLSIHQNSALRHLMCIPGDVISGGPKWYLVSDYKTLIPGKIVFFRKNDIEMDSIDKLVRHLNKKNIFISRILMKRLIGLPRFCLQYKHGTIFSKIQNISISKDEDDGYFLNINLKVNKNKNLKCIRRNLDNISSEWSIFSSYGSGTKLFPVEISIY